MLSFINRKRSRDATDDAESLHHEKKLRCSAGHEQHSPMTSTSASLFQQQQQQQQPATDPLERLSSGEDGSISSTISEASSPDPDMDMDTSSDFRMAFSQSPETSSSSSWALRSAPLRNPRMALNEHGSRVPTPIISTAIRPQPMPVQVPYNSTMPVRSQLGYTVERFPSPISEDEPHTPTTVAGSQLSLLTVTDVDMDMAPPEPPEPSEPLTVRKQRQRSGAFTSPREPSKKFIMGYREDCEKCRNRVPGHMSHFLGA